MRIASLLPPDMESALAVWLQAYGHEMAGAADAADRLVLDYAHLQQAAKSPVSARNWLLMESQLNNAQMMQALQQGCGYITTAPLCRVTLDNWIQGSTPLANIFALNADPQAAPAADPYLAAFIDILTGHIWTPEQREQAKQLIPYRDIALQLEHFQGLLLEGKLSPLQQAQLACHTLVGAKLLMQQGHKEAADIARQHHEHFDGTGYPGQIKGDGIHPYARLAKLYDSYTGLRRQKAYAKALDHPTSMQKLQYGDGYLWPSQFDPQLLHSLIDKEAQIAELFAPEFD